MARSRWPALAVCGLLGASIFPGRAAGAAAAVLLVGPRGSRVGDQLARELAASGFSFVRIENDADLDDLRWGPSDEVVRGVFVGPGDRSVVVLARLRSGAVFARLELPVGAQDDLTRRRVCLMIVEHLRVLVSAAAPPFPASVPAEDEAPAPALPGPALRTEAVATTVALEMVPPPSPRLWTTGVAVAFDQSSAIGPPTGYLQLFWQRRLGARGAVRIRGDWPLWGAEIPGMYRDTRIWTFGAGAGLHYALGGPTARLRPYVGVGAGFRVLLSEFRDLPPLSEVTWTPTVNVGVQAGVAYRLSASTYVFFESGAARNALFPNVDRVGYLDAAANAISWSSSLGLMLEY